MSALPNTTTIAVAVETKATHDNSFEETEAGVPEILKQKGTDTTKVSSLTENLSLIHI